jgi:hypothetical protein
MFDLKPATVCVIIVSGCLLFSLFRESGLVILKDLMIAAVSGYFGYLHGSKDETN